MKPKTKIQKEVARLSRRLPKITEAQEAYACRHCFDHIGRKTAKGVITCTECGYTWQSDGALADSSCGCTCPHCGTELQVVQTLKRIFAERAYFCVLTTCKGFQVLRFFYVNTYRKVGQKADYWTDEVVQRWIAPDGRTVPLAKLRPMFGWSDSWIWSSDLEVRPDKQLYDVSPQVIYPRMSIIPALRQRGFTGKTYGLTPFRLIHGLLACNRLETLLKIGQIPLLQHFSLHSYDRIDTYWPSVKIAARNGYIVPDGSLWCDYLDELRNFGKDLHNPKYVCPTDLQAEHDRWMHKRQERIERERLAEQQRRIRENESTYREQKSRFFGLAFSDKKITVRVLESVREFYEEGKAMHHCVFSNAYYERPDSLILSATIGGKRIETVEVSLATFDIVQSRGVCNSQTEYHKRIVKLVRKNMPLIVQRMTA